MTREDGLEKFKVKKHELYAVWRGMKARCYNENNPSYKHYGARGISVCDEWINDFKKFIDDMGPRPKGKGKGGLSNYSLDRIDNDKGYSPENCRWATISEQNINRRKLPNALEYPGVYPCNSRFRARLIINGKLTHLGTHDTKIDAYKEILRAKIKYRNCKKSLLELNDLQG